jgi:hypothetical protein
MNIVKIFLREIGQGVWTGFIRLRTKNGGVLLKTPNEQSDFIKCWSFF